MADESKIHTARERKLSIAIGVLAIWNALLTWELLSVASTAYLARAQADRALSTARGAGAND